MRQDSDRQVWNGNCSIPNTKSEQSTLQELDPVFLHILL